MKHVVCNLKDVSSVGGAQVLPFFGCEELINVWGELL